MKKPVRILIVEDIADDADLAKNEICRILSNCEFQVVATYEGFVSAIETFEPDVIISDYTLPRFDGLKALALTQKHTPLTPFIMWAGSISEKLGVECMRAGANNYISKDNLRRLGPAVVHALEERNLLVARKQAEERYQSIFENSMEGIFQSSPQGRYLNLNPAMARIYGYASPAEMMESIYNIGVQIYVEPDERSEFARQINSQGRVQNFEARNYRKDGSIIWTSTSARSVCDQHGNVSYYEGFTQDITQRKEAEEAFQSNEKRFRALIENGLDDISLLAADGRLLWESPSTVRNLGYEPEEFVGRNIFELMHPDDLEWTRNTYAKLLQRPGDRQRGIFRLRRSDGTWRWVEAIATNLVDDSTVNAIVVNYRDITEQKQAEIELQQRNDDLALINVLNEIINRGENLDAVVGQLRSEFKRIFSSEYTNIYLLNPDGQSIKLHQYSIPLGVAGKIEKVIGRAMPAIEIPVQEDGLFQRVLRSGHGMVISDPKEIKTWIGEFVETASLPAIAKAAIRKLLPQIYKILNIQSTILVPLISDGKVLGVLNVSGAKILTEQDLKRIEKIGGQLTTALRRRQVEDALRESQARYQNLVETSHDLIWSVDVEGRFTFVNRASREIYGYEPEELIGRSFFEILDPKHYSHNDLKAFKETIANVDEFKNVETHVQHRDGRQFILSANSIALRDEHGNPTGVVGSSHDITIRKQVEDALKEERNLLRTLIDNVPDRIYAMDMQGRKTLSNTADWLASGGKTMEDVIGRTDFDLYPPEMAEGFWRLDKAVLDSGQPVINYEEPGLDAGGNRVSVLTSKIPLRDEAGNVIGLVGVGRDITERKRIEQALQESQDKLEFAQRIAHVGHFEHNLDTNVITMSDEIYRILGLEPRPDLRHSNGTEQIHPDDRAKVSQALADCINTEQPFIVEYRIVRPDGQERFIYSEGGLIRGNSNHPPRVFGIAQDITERRQAEERLRYSENRYRLVTQATNDIIWEWNPETHQLFWSENAQHVFGYSEKEIGPDEMWWDNHIHPDDRERVLTKLNELIEGKASIWKEEYRFLLKDGSYAYISDRAYIERDANGDPQRMIGAMANITERKQAEEELRQSQSRYRALVETQTDFIVRWQPDGTRTFANEAYRKYFGLASEGALAESFMQLIHEDDRQSVENRLQRLISGATNVETGMHRVIRPDGSVGWQEWTDQAIRDNHGQLIELQSVGRDITERKQAETERQALFEIMQGFADTKDLQELLKLVHQSIANVIYAENFFVVLHHESTGLFEEIYSVDQYDPPEPPSKLEHSITSYVFRSGKSLLLTQTVFDELAARGEVKLIGTNSASWLGVPLKTSGRTIGVMAVQDYENDNRYSDREKDFLSSIATQVALMIEHRRAGEALRESEEHYRTIFEGVQDAIFVESLDGKIQMVNERACEMFGYTQAEFLTKTVADLVPPGHSLLMGGGTGESLSAEPRETVNQRANGEAFPIEISGRIQVINGEKVLLVVVREITERKRSEAAEREQRILAEALRDTAETLSSTLDYGEVLDHILTAVGRVVPHDAASILLIEGESAKVVRSYGYDKHDYDLQIMGVRLPLDETTNLRQMLETRQPEIVYDTFSYPGWKRMSATDWLRSSVGAPISIYSETIGFICLDSQTPEYFTPKHAERLEAFANQAAIAMHNARLLLQAQEEIAERRKVETALLESNTRFRTLFEASPDAIVLIDPNQGWSIIDCNTVACQMNGYSREELLGQCIDILNATPPQPNERAKYMERIQQHGVLHYETSHRRKDGTIFTVDVSTSLIKFDTRDLILGIDRDITERKRAEEALRTEREKAQKYLDIAGVVMLALDRDGTVTLINQKGCEILGYSVDEIIGKNWINNFIPEAVCEGLQKAFQEMILGDDQLIGYYENAVLTNTGEQRLIAWHNSVVVDPQGVIIGTLSSGEDITERKRAEEEIRRRAEETSALLETSLALTYLDLEVTLQTIGNSANTLFLADGCRVFLMEPDGETLHCVLALGENTAAFSGLKIRIGEGVTGAVAATGMAEIVNEMQNDPRAVQVSGTDEEQEAVMFAPLKERDRTIGILSVRRVGENPRFEPADLGLLEAFASMAASAVSNARLFEETQRRLADLHASEERFLQLADNIQEAFWMTDAATGREIYMSPAVETIWGRSVESLMYEPDAFINSVVPEDQPAVLDAIKKEKDGERAEVEYRVLRPDGSVRWIWDRAFPVFDDSGKVKRIAGISADVTERKEAAEKLRESEDRYHSLFQNQLHGSALHEIITNDQDQPVDYIFIKVNPAFENMTGLKAQDLIGRRVTEVLPGIENERLIQIYGQVALTGEPAHLNEYFAPLGRYYEINAYATGPRQFAVSFMDVTERRQAEQELRKLSRAVEQSGSTIVITDTSGHIEYVNPKFTQITGYSLEEVVGQNPRMLKSGLTAAAEYTQLWQTIVGGREWHGELLNKKKNGELFWESVTISPILNDRREITHFVGVKEDITQRKQSEIETRRHIAELEAVYENGLSVGRLLEPSEIGNRVIETFARYLPWHHVTIRLKKEERDDLELVAFNLPNLKEEERTDAEQHFIARISKVGQGLSGWVIQTGVPLRTGNVHAHPQYIDTHVGIQSGLYVPLKVGERVIGVISVESESPNAFTEQDERLLATLANQTAVAFENARLYEAMQKELSERRRVEDALRVSETHYRALADSITDILFELDQDLHYTHWNKASETLTGIPAQDAVGKSMEEILGDTPEQARIRAIYEDVLKSHKPRMFETTLVFNGEKRSFETTAYPSMRGVSVVAKDVTDRKRTEAIMQKRFELMEYSARHSLKDLMQRTVDEVSELTESTIGFFHFMEDDQSHLGMQSWSSNALRLFQVPANEGAHRSLDQAGVWADAVRQRRPLIQNDYESLTQKRGIPQGHVPIIREIVIPIIRNECIMAVMGIGNKSQDYTPQDLEIAARLADYAWDITERKQMEIALETERNQLVERVEERTSDLSRANSNLARALRVKDEFLANMSHELRTPLNAILGLSESLGEQIAGPLNEKQQKYISTISESGHHLLSLINDILDLAKIDAGHITLDINKVDIRSVCQASLRMIKQLAQKKNQEVSLEIDDGLGLMWADERRLKQMIVNLLGNAVKFTPEDGNLGLEVHGDKDANQVAITVWDNGIGIKQGDLERLFQPFVQLDSGLAREATGTGLGLALVAQMARLHGGGVTAFSEAGKGSRFTIILPWEPALAIDTASRMKITGKFRAIQVNDTNKPTILVVEDTQEVVMMLKDYLELTGYNVFTAQDGIDGIVQARHVKPDLILMDVQMPRMDGFETTRKLRGDPNFRYTPIIALTALAMPHDRERCLEAGMDEYISKPVNLKALVKIIQNCLFEQGTRTR